MRLNLNEDFELAAKSMTTPKKTPSVLEDVGFTDRKVIVSEKGIAKFCAEAIYRYLELTLENEKDFQKAISDYLSHLGVVNEKTLAMATFGEPPTDLVGTITPVIRTMFGKLSKMAQVAQTNGIFLYDAEKITLSVE